MTYILGIHVSHNSAVCLLKDGEIVALVQEERFNRKKNTGTFPSQSIKWVLESAHITISMLDAVAIGGLTILPTGFVQGGATSGYTDSGVPLTTQLWRHIDYRHAGLRKLFYPLVLDKRKKLGERGRELLKQNLKSEFGIDPLKVHFIEHHVCHAYTAYYGLRTSSKNPLVLTLDGEGDYYCASVNTVEDGLVVRVASTPWYHSLGYIYSQTTTFLGMKALEHEYKVMGLAPHAKDYFKRTYKQLYEPYLSVDKESLEFTSPFPTNRFINHLREHAVGERFDNLAAAVQNLTEVRTSEWVDAALKRFGPSQLYLGGGVFMNVKLNLKISEMDGVTDVRPFPSCGDESNPIGAAYYVYLHHFSKKPRETVPLKSVYLGPWYSNDDIEQFINLRDLKRTYDISYHKDIEGEIATLLAKGKVVARLAGKSEWGARSLGNRAILGNPSSMETFYKVNDQIKMRDFWMPFAPSILAERANDYIENPKHIDAPYMIMAFHSTPLAQKELVAAIHQADKTCRPQIVQKDANPEYYRIIKEFEKLTGIGGVLNTSFNLHGEPNVLSPTDAIHTLEESGLEYLAMENWLVAKK